MPDNAFQAMFTEIRQVKGRKVYQLVFEVAAEAADKALQVLGGVPVSDESRWCAIARLTKDAATKPNKPKKRWSEMPASQRAAILCQDAGFIATKVGIDASRDEAANWLRQYCGVASRRDLDTNAEARKKFEQIETDYMAAIGRMAMP